MNLFSFTILLILCLVLGHNEINGQPETLDFIFKLRGKNLKPIESDWGVDGFVKLYINSRDTDCVARSETITNDKNPEWQYVFKYTYHPGWGSFQQLLIEVRHNNNNAKDDHLGEARINLDRGFVNPIKIYRDGSEAGELYVEHLMSSEKFEPGPEKC